jgi:nitrous oxidase accessory protein NosD
MGQRKIRWQMCLVIVAALLALTAAPAVAATLVVDDDGLASATDCDAVTPADSSTISGAIVIASPGDTIKVCPGLYAEQVSINKTLTLLGAQATVDARTRVTLPANESIIDHPCGPVQIAADGVTLDGFTVQGSTLPDPCFLSGIWMNPGGTGSQGGAQILNNIVQNNISGIELDSTCAATTTLVQFNLIQNNNNPGPGAGNGIQTNFGLCNADIDSNEFSGHVNSSVLVVAASSGLAVSNNELVGGTSERIVFGSVSTSTISGNVSIGSTSSGTIRLFGGNNNIAVDSNVLRNGMRGIRVDDIGIAPNTGVTASTNCIQGNTVAGLEAGTGGHTGTLNAENNWWGSSTGPTHASNPGGTGDAVIAPDNNVDFDPFLTSPPALPSCPAAPTPNTPGKVTGGGKITVGAGKATFGFTVTCCDPKGNLEYNDQSAANGRIKATSISTLVISSNSACSGKHAQFTGMATQSNTTGSVTFTVDVDDCGEPGSSRAGGPDTFSISTSAPYSASGPLIGGNVQIHE